MHRSSTLTLVIPRLPEQQPVDDSVHAPAGASLIEFIAGRGTLKRKWRSLNAGDARHESWQRGLIAALELNATNYPSAPLTAMSVDGEQLSDWLHAEPVHLVAGMNEVSLLALPSNAELTTEELAALTPALGAHLAIEGLELRTSGNGWLVGAQQRFKVDTVCVDYAMRNEWGAVLPRGDQAGRLRRLMTEMQMLLHEHPVNESRAARGIPVVNSVWLWGNGSVGLPQASEDVPSCFGNDEFLRGVCKVNGWTHPLSPQSAERVIDQARSSTKVIAVLNESTLSELESRWLEPSIAAVSTGLIGELRVVLDEWEITVDRWQLKKFWRRPLSFAEWTQR